MKETLFVVDFFKKKGFIVEICLLFAIEVALILMMIFWEYLLLSLILTICFSTIFAFFVVVSLLFKVQVSASVIKVRTRLGRRYQFTWTNIEKVVCAKRNSTKYGPMYYINILTASHELSMHHSMTNFQKMAGYILQQYEKGDMQTTAVSESCKKQLVKYKNGEIFKRKSK